MYNVSPDPKSPRNKKQNSYSLWGLGVQKTKSGHGSFEKVNYLRRPIYIYISVLINVNIFKPDLISAIQNIVVITFLNAIYDEQTSPSAGLC